MEKVCGQRISSGEDRPHLPSWRPVSWHMFHTDENHLKISSQCSLLDHFHRASGSTDLSWGLGTLILQGDQVVLTLLIRKYT